MRLLRPIELRCNECNGYGRISFNRPGIGSINAYECCNHCKGKGVEPIPWHEVDLTAKAIYRKIHARKQ